MSFISICPHCQECRLRAPSSKRGKSVRCPKCHEIFELTPQGEKNSFAQIDQECESRQSVARTTNGPQGSSSSTRENQKDEALQLAEVSLGANVLILVLTLLPFGRVVGALVALIASMVAAIAVSALEKKVWLGWASFVLNVSLLIILIAFPGILGLTGWFQEFDSKPEIAVNQEKRDTRWIDAGDAAWQQGGVRVAITFATVGTEPSNESDSGSKEKHLWVGIKITDVGVGGELEFKGWSTRNSDAPVLATVDGTRLATRKYLGPNGKTLLRPGRALECLLAFEIPPTGQDLLLDLPTQPFGDSVTIPFKIPHELIGRQ